KGKAPRKKECRRSSRRRKTHIPAWNPRSWSCVPIRTSGSRSWPLRMRRCKRKFPLSSEAPGSSARKTITTRLKFSWRYFWARISKRQSDLPRKNQSRFHPTASSLDRWAVHHVDPGEAEMADFKKIALLPRLDLEIL